MPRSRKLTPNHPELHLGLPPRAADDPRELLFSNVRDHLIRDLMRGCPAVSVRGSEIGLRLVPHNVPKSERWRWSGKELTAQRHQIDIPQLSEPDLVERLNTAETLIAECGISPLLAQVLVGRNHCDPAQVREFLAPSLASELAKLPPYAPLHYAAYFLHAAVLQEWHIVVVSDYDADGNCSAAILKRTLDRIGAHATVIQPDRILDGYGLGDSTLHKVQALNPKVVITLDCGTSNQKQIAALNHQNVLTIVVDHHELPPGKTASPDIMVNPKSDPLWEGYQGLCASGLSWLLAQSLLSLRFNNGEESTIARELLPLAAHGTIADVMEIRDLNRALVHEGFIAAQSSSLAALQAQRSKLHQPQTTGAQVGFVVAPQLNAPGRISPASTAGPGTASTLELLTTNDPKRAAELHHQNHLINERRKSFEREGLKRAHEILAERQKKGEPIHLGVAVFVPDAHEGVVGLIAARICEAMQCPVIVFTKDAHGNWKGSGRAIPGASLIQILRSSSLAPLIAEYGGHDAAAGLRVEERNRRRFEVAFSRVCSEVFGLSNPAEDSPFDDPPKRDLLPVVEQWYKPYRPDLILPIDELIARAPELTQAASALEPCGRSNPEISILLPRVRVVFSETTKNGHLRIVLEQGARDERDWRTAPRTEAIVFARSVAHQALRRIPIGTPVDIVIQSAFDQKQVFSGRGNAFSFQVLLIQPTAFTPPLQAPHRRQEKPTNKPDRLIGLAREKTHNLFQQALQLPSFSSASDFYEYSGITLLTPNVQFRPKQFEFVAKQLLKDELQERENLLLSVNTGGGKTLITFMKMAQVLSRDPTARALYLTPQTDLVEQAIASARLFFNLRDDEIVRITGDVSPQRRLQSYSGPGRLFIGTPQTAKIDGTINLFSIVGLDEIQMMRGDQPDREDTLYAYRWVVEQVLRLQDSGSSIRLWAQSGTPATSRPESIARGESARSSEEELAALARTLRARYEVATLPTGLHSWNAGQVSLSPEFRTYVTKLLDAARECYREFSSTLPDWITSDHCQWDLPASKRAVRATLRAFIEEYTHLGIGTFLPRGEFIDRYTASQRALNTLQRPETAGTTVNDGKVLTALNTLTGVDSKAEPWIWAARSRIHELQVLQRLFISLRSKGRAAFAHDVSFLMLKAMYPTNRPEPAIVSSHNVRVLRRPELREVLEWAMHEPIPAAITADFKRLYPREHRSGDTSDRAFTTPELPAVWEAIVKGDQSQLSIPRGDNAEQVDQRRKDALEPRMLREMITTTFSDPKEHHIEQFLRTIPQGSKTIIICDTKFDARLLATRLSERGLPALWYAGRSVKRSEKLEENLRSFHRGDVRILCGTSAVETGHDIPDVSFILRVVPLTSSTKNAQARGRAARQEGLQGEYQTIVIHDPTNPDIDEMAKYYRARTKLWAMEKKRRAHE